MDPLVQSEIEGLGASIRSLNLSMETQAREVLKRERKLQELLNAASLQPDMENPTTASPSAVEEESTAPLSLLSRRVHGVLTAAESSHVALCSDCRRAYSRLMSSLSMHVQPVHGDTSTSQRADSPPLPESSTPEEIQAPGLTTSRESASAESNKPSLCNCPACEIRRGK